MAKYSTTTAFEKIVSLDKRIRIIQGGKGSSKTISILMHFLLLAMSDAKGLVLSVVGETLPNLRSGPIRDFERIMKDWGVYNDFRQNKNENKYTYGDNVIEFFSVDGEGSRLGSRRSHLYVNEGDYIKFSTFLELYSRTSHFTYVDYNPRRKFWAHTELQGQSHVDFIILNYMDNEFIPESELESVLWFKKKAEDGSKFFENKWRVLGLGQLGITEGVIFENWKKFDTIPSDAEYLGSAIDWGFSQDPTGVVKIFRFDGRIYVEEFLYRKGLLNSQIANLLKSDEQIMSGIVIADAAEPKSIAELRSYGIPIKKSDNKDINFGISVMQEYEFALVGYNLVQEFENYSYKFNKAGENLGVPVDDWNHCFVGETMVATKGGAKRIDEVKVGDMVHTSAGLKRVLNTFENGCKEIFVYKLFFTNFVIEIKCTSNHKFKTTKGWKKITTLKAGDILYNYLTVKNISDIKEKGISPEVKSECTELSGSITTEKYRKGLIFTTKTSTQKITTLKTLNACLLKNIKKRIWKAVEREVRAKSNSRTSTILGTKQKNGTQAKRGANGTQNKPLNHTKKGRRARMNAYIVGSNMNPSNLAHRNIAQTIASLRRGERMESTILKSNVSSAVQDTLLANTLKQSFAEENVLLRIEVVNKYHADVFDIEVEEVHEYFANGVLVHNCIDPLRYFCAEMLRHNKNTNLKFVK